MSKIMIYDDRLAPCASCHPTSTQVYRVIDLVQLQAKIH